MPNFEKKLVADINLKALMNYFAKSGKAPIGSDFEAYKAWSGENGATVSKAKMLEWCDKFNVVALDVFIAGDYVGMPVYASKAHLSEAEVVVEDHPRPKDVDGNPLGKTKAGDVEDKTPAKAEGLSDDEREILRILRAGKVEGLTEDQVINLIHKHGSKVPTTKIHLKVNDIVKELPEGLYHHKLAYLIACIQVGVPTMIVGPAGCGKTFVTRQVADLLDKAFFVTSSVSSEFKLTGYNDAYGNYNSTLWRKCFENGGVFAFDEFDRSAPAALMAMNSGIANGMMDFPDAGGSVIERHKQFCLVATANTFGTGPDKQYTTATALDASTRDRFFTMEWDYDLNIEAALIGVKVPKDAQTAKTLNVPTPEEAKELLEDWFNFIQSARKAFANNLIDEVVSTRAIENGRDLLLAGLPWDVVADGIVYNALDKEQRTKVERSITARKRFGHAA